jgi:hypothetical protein
MVASTAPLKLLGESLEVPVHTIPRRKVDFRGWMVRGTFLLAESTSCSTQPPPPFMNTNEAHVSAPANETHLLVTASFGRILRPSLLQLFLPSQRLNVHPSLLPAYRGPAPIQRALMRGENVTGVCVIDMMEKKEGIDAGSVWGCESMASNTASKLSRVTHCNAGCSRKRHIFFDVRGAGPDWRRFTCHSASGYVTRKGESSETWLILNVYASIRLVASHNLQSHLPLLMLLQYPLPMHRLTLDPKLHWT